MYSNSTSDIPAIESIILFWRTHDDDRRLPVREQSWWFTLCDVEGGMSSMEFDTYCSQRYVSMTEAVVAIGEELDILIDEEQVCVDTHHRVAEWNQGA